MGRPFLDTIPGNELGVLVTLTANTASHSTHPLPRRSWPAALQLMDNEEREEGCRQGGRKGVRRKEGRKEGYRYGRRKNKWKENVEEGTGRRMKGE